MSAQPVERLLSGPGVRFALVAVLVLLMLIPLSFVESVSAERQRYFNQVAAEIAFSWGPRQALSGPFLVVPQIRRIRVDSEAGGDVWRKRREMRVVLPKTLDVTVDVQHQMRTRAICGVPVFEAVAGFRGTFLVPDVDAASVSLFQPVTGYTLVDRGIKHGVLFIGLTFLSFICFEMLSSMRFHYVQYAVVGAGLVLFYLALLALSEHLDFRWAYLLAVALLAGLVTWYAWMMTRLVRVAAGLLGVLVLLYACLYVLLDLEAYALLAGTGVLLAGLVALMYSTKHLTYRSS